ncbi:unnamed protein product [Symbiodinium sp. KB8]|nr:unnamed protein product [Symbiodinium sp. KB8]
MAAERAVAALYNSSWYQDHLAQQDEERTATAGMASGRSHVSSEEDDDDTRRLDRATSVCAPRAGSYLSAFSTAVLIHRVICTGVWNCLRLSDRQSLIATCREADGWCLRHIRAYAAPSMPPLQTLPSSFAGQQRFVLGRFARGVRMQRCKADFFRRLGTLEPVFNDLDAMACEDLSATPLDAHGQEQRTLHDVVADLAHQDRGDILPGPLLLKMFDGRGKLVCGAISLESVTMYFVKHLLYALRWDDCWSDLEIVKAMASIPDNEGRKDSLLDWLHPRAPATLIKRVNSILLYHKEVGWGQEVVPYREHSVYCYMRDAKAGGAKPSQLAALREALIFVRFVFDVPSLDPIVKSRRILGITRRGAKRGRMKAHPLRVCDFEVLHTLLESASSMWDKLFSGACLACLYMRARWSDFQHTCAFSIDYSEDREPAYLEFRAEVFKTMNAKFFDGEPMIWVAPAQGIYRHNWVKLWMQVRQELELESCQPPLPVPREGGGATAGAVVMG